MKLSDITAWLASEQEFAQGAALYAALGASATYKRLFALGASEYARQVLLRELTSLVHQVRHEIAAVAPPPPPAAPEAAGASPPPAPDSPVLRQVRQQLKAVRDERSHLHPQLTAKGLRRTERQVLAGRIVALTDQELELKAHEAHVLAHGRLPGPVPAAELTDAGELRQRLTNLRSLRSKLRKRADRAADLADVEAQITLIQSKLSPE